MLHDAIAERNVELARSAWQETLSQPSGERIIFKLASSDLAWLLRQGIVDPNLMQVYAGIRVPLLHNAVWFTSFRGGAKDLLRCLLVAGANVEELCIGNQDPFTALHYACIVRSRRAIKELLRAGASTHSLRPDLRPQLVPFLERVQLCARSLCAFYACLVLRPRRGRRTLGKDETRLVMRTLWAKRYGKRWK